MSKKNLQFFPVTNKKKKNKKQNKDRNSPINTFGCVLPPVGPALPKGSPPVLKIKSLAERKPINKE